MELNRVRIGFMEQISPSDMMAVAVVGIRLRIRTYIGFTVDSAVHDAKSQVFDTIWREIHEA